MDILALIKNQGKLNLSIMFDKIYFADLNKHDMYVKIMQFSSHCW